MNKFEKLEKAIITLPEEYKSIRIQLMNLLQSGSLQVLLAYVTGLYDMALHLTSDEQLLRSLIKIRGFL